MLLFIGHGGTLGRQPSAAGKCNFFERMRTDDYMIRKLTTGEYRLYSRKVDPKTQRRRNLGTFKTRAAAAKHEREVQYFKRH
jgi:hypothetical protein